LFDITFCYFPITFRPPPGNPEAYGGITAEELTHGLIDCLSATPQFGILVLPLLLEKFQAPGVAPKVRPGSPNFFQDNLFSDCLLLLLIPPLLHLSDASFTDGDSSFPNLWTSISRRICIIVLGIIPGGSK
jgi:hypothetical protein